MWLGPTNIYIIRDDIVRYTFVVLIRDKSIIRLAKVIRLLQELSVVQGELSGYVDVTRLFVATILTPLHVFS